MEAQAAALRNAVESQGREVAALRATAAAAEAESAAAKAELAQVRSRAGAQGMCCRVVHLQGYKQHTSTFSFCCPTQSVAGLLETHLKSCHRHSMPYQPATNTSVQQQQTSSSRSMARPVLCDGSYHMAYCTYHNIHTYLAYVTCWCHAAAGEARLCPQEPGAAP